MTKPLPWLGTHDPFPPVTQSWGPSSAAPGLLAAGGALDIERLCHAYAHGIFPWFSEGQPILWWSPDPRMVLHVREFRLHRSLRRTLKRFCTMPGCEVHVDSNFCAVIRACAHAPRAGQSGTWIVPQMLAAYRALHVAGHAHSVETWVNGELVGGLYFIAIGRAVFGESMFSHATDASKIALAALVALCRQNSVEMIDCQQNTPHLASLGAREISRADFLRHVQAARGQPACEWHFRPDCWDALWPSTLGHMFDA